MNIQVLLWGHKYTCQAPHNTCSIVGMWYAYQIYHARIHTCNPTLVDYMIHASRLYWYKHFWILDIICIAVMLSTSAWTKKQCKEVQTRRVLQSHGCIIQTWNTHIRTYTNIYIYMYVCTKSIHDLQIKEQYSPNWNSQFDPYLRAIASKLWLLREGCRWPSGNCTCWSW